MQTIDRNAIKSLVGRQIYAVKQDGTVHHGKLLRVKGNRLFLGEDSGKAHTKAVIPLVLFDLLAIGAYGGYGGYPYFGGYPYGGYPFFW